MADINNFLAQGWDPVAKRNQFLQMKQRELDLQGMRNALAYQPEELEFQRYLRQQAPYENGIKALEDIVNYAPMINLDNYESFVNYAVGRGAPKQWFPAKSSFANNEDFQSKLSQQVTSVKDLMTKHAMGLKEREVKAKEITAEAAMKKAGSEPNLNEPMIRSLPPTDPRRINFLASEEEEAKREKPITPYQKAELEQREKFHRENLAKKTDEDTIVNRIIVREALKQLPKLRDEGVKQNSMVDLIDKALDLTKKGVTGKGGELKAILAPYAEMAGIPTESLTDAQAFQALTRVIVGPMRLDIVGAGQVSDYENKLMKQVSGGGGMAKQAAVELLQHWRRRALDKVNEYNLALEGATNVAPETAKVYKPLKTKAPTQQPPEKTEKKVAKKEYSPSRNQTRFTYSDGTTEIRNGKQ